MIEISIICVGKMKEKFYISAAEEYIKRIGAYGRINITELPEVRRPASHSLKETQTAIMKEAEAIKAAIPKGAMVIAMCIEGQQYSSEELSRLISDAASAGTSRICFLIGGSDGLHESVKALADVRMSMSRMTFPHHLARVMLLEQIYRAFSISAGGKYHK